MNSYFLHAALGLAFVFLCTAAGSAAACFLNDDTAGKHAPLLGGISAGIMLSSSVWSLLVPAFGDGSPTNVLSVAIGFAVGAVVFTVLGVTLKEDEKGGYKNLFIAMTAHNVPEGASVGFAYGAAAAGAITPAAAFAIAVGIGVQNIPEGAAIVFPARKFTTRKKAFLLGALSGIVEPLFGFIGLFAAGAAVRFMPALMAFAAAAMVYTVFSELSKDISVSPVKGAFGACAGFLAMTLLDVLLG